MLFNCKLALFLVHSCIIAGVVLRKERPNFYPSVYIVCHATTTILYAEVDIDKQSYY